MGKDQRALTIPTPDQTLPGRSQKMPVPPRHEVSGAPLEAPFPPGTEQAVFGMGCFWGAERKFWQTPGVVVDRGRLRGRLDAEPDVSTRSARARPATPRWCWSCSIPRASPTTSCCASFWEEPRSHAGHAPGQRRRDAVPIRDLRLRRRAAARGRGVARRLPGRDCGPPGSAPITTEIRDAPPFYYAEDYHQQYLHKNPGGYCGLGGTGVSCPVGMASAAKA